MTHTTPMVPIGETDPLPETPPTPEMNPNPTPITARASMSRRSPRGTTLVLLGLAVVVGWLLYSLDPFGLFGSDEAATTDVAEIATSEVVATQAIEVRDLVETSRLSGTLGFDDAFPIMARVGGSVSSAPLAGTPVARGDELFRVDGRPTVAFYGESAAWRELSSEAAADADIRQLEENLAALGFDPDHDLVIDDSWTSATTASVKRWQRDLGTTDDGIVRLSDVVFVPGPGEVTSVEATQGMGVGDGSPILNYQVHADVDTTIGYREGNVTSLAPVGAPVVAGEQLFSVNTNVTYALIADNVSNTRTMQSGVADGSDIRALEENLVALGYDPDAEITIDREWDDATTDAVERWEAAIGLEESGITTPQVFQFVEPGSLVTGHLVAVSDEVGDPTPMLEVGRSGRRIEAAIPAQDQDLIAVGEAVAVSLPDGGSTDGVVTEIARNASEGPDGDTLITFSVQVTDPDAFGDLVGAPVRITVESRRTDAVLAVPSAALVGLVEGGHAVEVVEQDGSRQLFAVELGAAADGWIEISAGAVTEGQLVVVPR